MSSPSCASRFCEISTKIFSGLRAEHLHLGDIGYTQQFCERMHSVGEYWSSAPRR
jgi:hypothetical protein